MSAHAYREVGGAGSGATAGIVDVTPFGFGGESIGGARVNELKMLIAKLPTVVRITSHSERWVCRIQSRAAHTRTTSPTAASAIPLPSGAPPIRQAAAVAATRT